MIATITTSTIAAFGIHGFPKGPITRFRSHGDAAPPGASRTSRAQPAHTNDMASVTTMSGTRVMTTRAPLVVPITTPRSNTPTTTPTPNASLWPSIRLAAMTLVSAMTEPIDKSSPPAMTTTAWATAANARGRIEIPRPCTPARP